MRRVTVAVVIMLAAALVTSGCFRLEVTVDVRPDGSGTAQEVFAVDRRKAVEVLGAGDNLELAIPRAGTISNLPVWARATDYRRGGLEGVAIDFDFPTAADLGPRLALLTDAVTSSTGSQATSSVTLRREGGGWRFEAHQSDLGLTPDRAVLGSDIRSRLYDTAELRLTLRLPGRITAHNATEAHGNELTWALAPGDDATDLYATSAPLGAASPARPGHIALALVALAALAGGTALLVLSRKARTSPAGAAPGRGAPVGTAVGGATSGHTSALGDAALGNTGAPGTAGALGRAGSGEASQPRALPQGPPSAHQTTPEGPTTAGRTRRTRRPAPGTAPVPASGSPADWPASPPPSPPLAPPTKPPG